MYTLEYTERKKKMENKETQVVSIRLPSNVVGKYDELAKKYNMTRNTFLATLLKVGFVIVGDDENEEDKKDVLTDAVSTIEKAVNRR